MINHTVRNITLSQQEYNQYARHIILDQVGIEGQQRLKQAKILVVGAGGLACPCIIYLVACGIGTIGIVDSDIISISNLQRQVLYGSEDIGKMKTIIAKEKILELNKKCVTKIYPYQLANDNAIDLIKQYDIIVDASDNFKTRYIIDDACYKLHRVHVYGAIHNLEGQVSVFNYQGGPRYSDLYPKYLNLNSYTCSAQGVLGVIPGVIGVLQATETIKIILGVGKVLSNSMIVYNAYNIVFRKLQIRILKRHVADYNDNINNHGSSNSICKLDLKSIRQVKLTFIDIRQKVEFDREHIKNAINIPLKLLKSSSKISLIKQYSKNSIVIIYCDNNSRSIIASQVLCRYQIKHFRLKNGLHDWERSELLHET